VTARARSRRHAWPAGHWDWYQHLAFKHGVTDGRLIFVGGQVDKDASGAPLHAGDLPTQTGVVVGHIDTVLRELGAGLRDVTSLVAFYATDGTVDERGFLADVGRHWQARGGAPDGRGPAIMPVPLPWLALPGMVVEIEAIALVDAAGGRMVRRAANPGAVPPLPAPFSHGVRWNEHCWVSGQTGAGATPLDGIARVLEDLGAELADVVKLNVWFGGDEGHAEWAAGARARAAHFRSPGPVVLELPTPRLAGRDTARIGAWAMRGVDGRPLARRAAGPVAGWTWPIELPYAMGLECGDLVFVGGQLPLDAGGRVADAGDLVAQTRRAMEASRRVLGEFGLDLDDMVKQGSFYRGDARPEVIVANQRLRSSYYAEPAGASTGVPLPFLALPDTLVAIETIASRR
jgi:enamine deaminase RidA (YjgF/YER057c/UK114 family)